MFRKPTHTEAKATEQGWVSIKTGELLTSFRGLLSKLKEMGLNEFGEKIKKSAPKVEKKPAVNPVAKKKVKVENKED